MEKHPQIPEEHILRRNKNWKVYEEKYGKMQTELFKKYKEYSPKHKKNK